jgi:hypothetical protein
VIRTQGLRHGCSALLGLEMSFGTESDHLDHFALEMEQPAETA